MSTKFYKIHKDTLTEITSDVLTISNVNSIVIQHVYDSVISDEANINFTISFAEGHVPYLENEEFMIVIREKVDATSRGPHDITITNVGKDIGRSNYKNKVPHRPWEFPQGFKELKGIN